MLMIFLCLFRLSVNWLMLTGPGSPSRTAERYKLHSPGPPPGIPRGEHTPPRAKGWKGHLSDLRKGWNKSLLCITGWQKLPQSQGEVFPPRASETRELTLPLLRVVRRLQRPDFSRFHRCSSTRARVQQSEGDGRRKSSLNSLQPSRVQLRSPHPNARLRTTWPPPLLARPIGS